MCLNLKSEKIKKQIAKKDIVVYKALKRLFGIETINELSKVNHGDLFKGIIKGINCEGKISIQNEDLYFCTNDIWLNGHDAYDKLGYKYSWRFDRQVDQITVNGEIILGKEFLGYKTYYQEVEVKIGETYSSTLNKCWDTVEQGLHSFGKLEDAKTFTSFVAKCIIPKGSRYYKGTFGDSYLSYASNKLTYVEIIE